MNKKTILFCILFLSFAFLKIHTEHLFPATKLYPKQNLILKTIPSGFLTLAANFHWIALYDAWQQTDWIEASKHIQWATTLQPNEPYFWETGAWHLAWNASLYANTHDDSAASLQWIRAGEELLKNGIDVNPDNWTLWSRLAELYWQRQTDYVSAANAYLLAAQKPNAPLYLQRMAGYALLKARNLQAAYEHFLKLYSDQSTMQKNPVHAQYVQKNIRQLESLLNIPYSKRIFIP